VNVGGSIFPLLASINKKKKQKGSGWWEDFKRNTRQGYKETRDLINQNKALQSVFVEPMRSLRRTRRKQQRRSRQKGGFFKCVDPCFSGVG